MKKHFLGVLTAAALIAGINSSSANAANFGLVGSGWWGGENSNQTAMDIVFGSGGWDQYQFGSVDGTSLFSASQKGIFIDGSDILADEMESFLSANMTTMQNWVFNGGNLFLNPAPNEGNGMDLGFGVHLNFEDSYYYASNVGNAVDPSHPIFNGPFTPVTTSYTGTSFAHATVSGNGLEAIINGTAGTILASLDYGNGHVLFGGMTTTNFHNPDEESLNLRANMLSLINHNESPTPAPEPASMLLMGIAGAAGLLARKKARA